MCMLRLQKVRVNMAVKTAPLCVTCLLRMLSHDEQLLELSRGEKCVQLSHGEMFLELSHDEMFVE
jgi:hypothetical protein